MAIPSTSSKGAVSASIFWILSTRTLIHWYFRNSYGGSAYKSVDLLSLSAPKVIWEIQKINSTPDEAWKYIEEKRYHHLLLDDDHYYALDVFGCDDEWFIVAVPSVKSRYTQSFLVRLLFLDFSEVIYPIILGVENKYQHVIEDLSRSALQVR